MKTFIGMLLLLPSLICAQALDPEPLTLKLHKNATIEFSGLLTKWNGSPPNLRFINDSNQVFGVDYDRLPTVLKDSLKNKEGFKGRFRFKYFGKVDLPYYDKPLQMFRIVKIISLSQ